MGVSALATAALQNLFAPHNTAPEIPKPNSSPQARKLYKACQQFESILITNLWSEMDKGVSMTDPGNDPGASTMQGLGIQSASMGIAESGGLGIAKMLYQDLAPRLAAGATGPG